jgi:hypothetical protein
MPRFIFIFLFLTLIAAPQATAQSDPLVLTLSRDFGAGFGLKIQGRFSYRVTGPEDLVRVQFLLDGEPIGEDDTAPFAYQFQTENYADGVHVMQAVGFTSSGDELASNTITREFISGTAVAWEMARTLIPILVLIIVVNVLVFKIAGRRSSTSTTFPIDGPFGGAICRHCHKPFARHIWGINLLVGKLDRCPHCHRWSLTNRAPQDLLQAAYEAHLQATSDTPPTEPSADNPDGWQKRLDDSRFD